MSRVGGKRGGERWGGGERCYCRSHSMEMKKEDGGNEEVAEQNEMQRRWASRDGGC